MSPAKIKKAIKDKDAEPDANEFGKTVSFLRKQKPEGMNQGKWNQEVTEQIGNSADRHTRAQVAKVMRNWLDMFAKA